MQGLGSPDTHENPIWTLAKEFNLSTTYSNYSNVSTYNEHGFKDYSHFQDEYDAAYEIAAQKAGTMLKDNLQDQSAQAGLALAGWRPKSNNMEAQAIDWWNWGMSNIPMSEELS